MRLKTTITSFDDIFGERCGRLVEAFIETEALCYDKNIDKEFPIRLNLKRKPLILSQAGEDWVQEVSSNILEEFEKKLKEISDAKLFRFISVDNTKTITNQLIVVGKGSFYSPTGAIIEIILCICGQPSCWGKIIVKKEEKGG